MHACNKKVKGYNKLDIYMQWFSFSLQKKKKKKMQNLAPLLISKSNNQKFIILYKYMYNTISDIYKTIGLFYIRDFIFIVYCYHFFFFLSHLYKSSFVSSIYIYIEIMKSLLERDWNHKIACFFSLSKDIKVHSLNVIYK